MCGILGSVNISFDSSVLDLLKHRGPDDFGLVKTSVNGHEVQLGQRRLSILDLSPAGHQPMFTECGNYGIILNGEIYNHKELRDKLPEGINFKGHSDTETILYYLKEFGIEGAKDFNGIFAFAFLNIVDCKLILARDPFGVKPLYYFIGEDDKLAFASEIRPIYALIGHSNLDKKALASLLRLRYNPSPETLYSEIKKVHPGHFIELNLKNKVISREYNSLIDNSTVKHANPSAEHVKQYGQKLEEAVARQLLSDVEVGILLSGGVDSAMVAALARRHYNGNMKAFTIGFEGNYSEDEIEDAAETAELLGLEHKYRKISFTDFIDIVKKCTQIVEEPLATTSLIPMYYLSELASKDVKVVLTGQGADEPLGGYTRYKSEILRNSIPGFLRNTLQNVVKITGIRNEKIIRGVKSIGIKDDIERFLAVYEVFTNEEIMNLISVSDTLSFDKIGYFYRLLNCRDKVHPVERMMALDTRLNLADDLLNYTDKITMHFALECRVPMLDLELVKFIESLPVQFRLNLRERKIIHKQFAYEILPDKIINRRKKGFPSPTNSWFRNESDIIKSILLEIGTLFSKVFNQIYVSEVIELHLKGYNKEKQIFLLLCIYFWLDSLKDDPAFNCDKLLV